MFVFFFSIFLFVVNYERLTSACDCLIATCYTPLLKHVDTERIIRMLESRSEIDKKFYNLGSRLY